MFYSGVTQFDDNFTIVSVALLELGLMFPSDIQDFFHDGRTFRRQALINVQLRFELYTGTDQVNFKATVNQLYNNRSFFGLIDILLQTMSNTDVCGLYINFQFIFKCGNCHISSVFKGRFVREGRAVNYNSISSFVLVNIVNVGLEHFYFLF